jgi:hypothetical protein
MHFRTNVRWRRARVRRVAAAVPLASLAGALAALMASGPASPQATAAADAPCIPLVTCPTPPPPTHSSTPKPPPPSTQPPPPTSSPPRSTPRPTSYYPPPVYSQPADTPLPTLPPPSPGSPPAPPDLAVQTIGLDLASTAPSHPGAQVLLQATLEAQRDTDTYAVPHATVTFSITSSPGAGAFVDPAQTDSGDTGVVVITVQTGDQPGDTVVHAVSGNAAADFTVHADPAHPTPSPTPRHQSIAPVAANTGSNDSRRLMVAGLAALLAAMAGGYVAALVLGRLPNPLHRARVWGRRPR